jgi:aspartate racemase
LGGTGMHKKLGILGGMGPLATYTLYLNILESTPARADQDHINMVILNASNIPERTNAILNGGESPLPYLLDALKILENSGCDLIAIPCNTSHYFYGELQGSCRAEILNMIDLTAEKIKNLGIAKVYLMATGGTIKTGVYEKYLSDKNIEIMPASDEEIEEMMRVIYEIKAGKTPDTSKLRGIAEKYHKLGCEKIILGCTEFSTEKGRIAGLDENMIIDAMDILKDKILESFGITKKQ